MGSIGGPEILLVLAVFVLLFGAKKLPELGSSVGKSIKNFKRGIDDAGADDDDADQVKAVRVDDDDDEPVSKTSK